MGRVTNQTLETPGMHPCCPWFVQAQYGYDGDGRLLDLNYPGSVHTVSGPPQPGLQHQYSYDPMGRPTSLKYYYFDDPAGTWCTRAQGAQYNAAGQLTARQTAAQP